MAKTGHIVGIDPMTDRIVVLRKGMDGKAVRQVDVLTPSEATRMVGDLDRAVAAIRLREVDPGAPTLGTPSIEPAPEPEQTMLDLDSLTREEPTA